MRLQFLLSCSALFPPVGDHIASARLVWDTVHMLRGQQSVHFCWEINSILISEDKEKEITRGWLQFEYAAAEELFY